MSGASVGYIAVNREKGKFVVMIEYGFTKLYASCELNDALDVVNGKKPSVSIRRS